MKNIPQETASEQFLSGGGEMGERIRSKDWSKSPLGDVRHWPQSLKTCVRIVLTSRQPMFVWWGKDLINIYNDAYKAIVGGKHPRALGQPASEVWSEIWEDAIAPRVHTVMTKNEGTYDEALLLIMERNGYPEETYYTFSYSPVPGDNGGTDGIICANTDDTQRITNARQLRTLTELGKSITDCRNNTELFENTIDVLKQNPSDFPFAFLYEIDKDGYSAELVGTTSTLPPVVTPHRLDLSAGEPDSWQLREMIKTGRIVLADQLIARFGTLPSGAWQRSPEKALVIPILQTGQKLPFAALVVGLNPFRQPDGQYQSFFQLVADQVATSLVNLHAYEEERRRAEALAEIDKAKTAFFSNVSHEFRTPLTLMLGPLEELINGSDQPLAPQHQISIESTHRNAMRLLRLVNTLLDFSRIEADRVTAHFYPVDLCRFTADLAGNFQSIIENAGLRFEVDCRVPMDKVYVDREMWEKIVFNLLSNAFKYTLRGGIALTLREEDGYAVLRVRDTGVGIPAKELPHMFERFHRVQNSAGRTHEGTGIGLSLVKELVKIHQGHIAVDSREGKGSVFIVTVPMGKEHLKPAELADNDDIPYESSLSGLYTKEAISLTRNEPVEAEPPPGDDVPAAGRPVVLVVDDNADMRDYIRRLLDKYYLVETAVHGKQALEKIARVHPSLVISDVMMPVMDGMQLLHTIKSNPATASLPVILLSARAGEEATIEGYESGADDYLVKPFSARELMARVRSQIKMAHTRAHVERQLRNLFIQAPVATCILRGPQFVIEVANEPMLEIWGRQAAEVMNKTLLEALPEVEGQGYIELLTNVYLTGERFVSPELSINLYRKGVMENIYIRFVYEALREEDNSISGIMAVANEITDLVEARQKVESQSGRLEQKVEERTSELKQANEQLAKSNHELEQFAYIASHDLQEPLRKIQIFSGLLENNLHNSEAAAKYLGKISSSATRMTTLIRDVLNYSRLSQMNAGFEPVDLNLVLQNVVTDFELLVAEKNAVIRYDKLPVVKGITLQFHQLFSNLVSNSLKFSEGNPVITISHAWLSVEEVKNIPGLNPEQPWLRLVFEDNGIGFEQQYAEQIFTIFQRLNNRRFGGTGIGLALCRKIAENHHGLITAHSSPGSGAVFTIYLPVV